jgi:hypothetical protein
MNQLFLKPVFLFFLLSVMTFSSVNGQSTGATQSVTAFGCFAQSGDGYDFLSNGQSAPIVPAGTVPWTAPCGLQWISNNSQGLAPNPPPSVINFTRSFYLAPNLVSNGVFTLSFKADDEAQFYLNGSTVASASCVPPSTDDGFCQQSCQIFTLPASSFIPGQTNTLEITLTNLFNVPVGANYGWTGISYSLCVAPVTAVGTPTAIPTNSPTPLYTPTPTPTPAISPVPTQGPVFTPTPTPTKGCHPITYPNPCHGEAVWFHVDGGPYDEIRVAVYTSGLRAVCHFVQPWRGGDVEEINWNLKDDFGANVANGIYLVKIETHYHGTVDKYVQKCLLLR